MRILEIITPSRIGGAETNLVTITRGLTALNHEVTVFCPAGRPLVEYLSQRGIRPIRWRTWGKADLRTLVGLCALIRSRQVDIVHAHLSTASLLGSLAARLARRPCVVTVHGLSGARWYRFADKVVAVSEAVKGHLVAQGIPAQQIAVIYNGIPLEEYLPVPVAAARRMCGFDPSTTRVGIFGRLGLEKGQETALRAWQQVLQRYPEAILMLAGRGRSAKDLRALAASLRINGNVEFAGFVPDPKALMCACDVIVVPSRREGLGLAALEAMALERPVIVSDAGGLAEIVLHGETGLVFPRGEPQPLAEAIIRVLADPELGYRLGKAGRRRVEERFEAARQVAALQDLFLSELQACRAFRGGN